MARRAAGKAMQAKTSASASSMRAASLGRVGRGRSASIERAATIAAAEPTRLAWRTFTSVASSQR
jgi:hypothetical protein